MSFEIEQLSKTYRGKRRSLFSRRSPDIPALDRINLEIPTGTAFGIVGESGSGKSTLGRILCGLLQPSSGEVRFDGRSLPDWTQSDASGLRQKVQIVFQDPASSLNPRMRIGSILEQPLRNLAGTRTRSEINDRIENLLRQTGVPQDAVSRYPHEFSGGQLQRVGIARALAASPTVLILDEAVSALDVSVQAQILALLAELRTALGLTLVFISHDLAVVRHLCDHVAVLQGGKLVEHGATPGLFEAPSADYTRTLIESAPRLATR